MVFKQILFLFSAGILLAVANFALNPKRVAWDPAQLREGEIRLSTAFEMAAQHQIVWLDARSQAEYAAGHIPGAFLLNEDDWDTLLFEFLNNWDGESPIVVYCGSGGCQASHMVAARLREELGFDEISVLHGGWGAWEEANP